MLLRGLGGAPGSASGAARVLTSLADAASLSDGDVLVTHMTSPDWLPLLRRAAGVVTDSGGMTCHAAIVSRELGIPCVVGTGEATQRLRDGEIVTVDATRGLVLEGARASEPAPTSPIDERVAGTSAAGAQGFGPVTATQILVNLSEPSQVERVKDTARRRCRSAARRDDGARGAWRATILAPCLRKDAARISSLG